MLDRLISTKKLSEFYQFLEAKSALLYLMMAAVIVRYNVFYYGRKHVSALAFAGIFYALSCGLILLFSVYSIREKRLSFEEWLFLSISILAMIAGSFQPIAILGAIFFFGMSFLLARVNNITKLTFQFLKAIEVLALIVASLNILIYLTDFRIFIDGYNFIGLVGGRLSGFSGNPNRDGLVCALGLSAAVYRVFFHSCKANLTQIASAQNLRSIVFNFFKAILLVTAIMMSMSRGAILVGIFLVVFLFFFKLIYLKQFSTKDLIRSFVFVLFLAIFSFFSNSLVQTLKLRGASIISTASADEMSNSDQSVEIKPKAITDPDIYIGRNLIEPSAGGRFELWQACLKSFSELSIAKRLIGGGLNNIGKTCRSTGYGQYVSVNNMHNYILQSLIGLGWLGFISTIILTLIFLRVIIRSLQDIWSKRHQLPVTHYYLIILSAVMLFHGLVEIGAIFAVNIPSLMFWFSLAAIKQTNCISMMSTSR